MILSRKWVRLKTLIMRSSTKWGRGRTSLRSRNSRRRERGALCKMCGPRIWMLVSLWIRLHICLNNCKLITMYCHAIKIWHWPIGIKMRRRYKTKLSSSKWLTAALWIASKLLSTKLGFHHQLQALLSIVPISHLTFIRTTFSRFISKCWKWCSQTTLKTWIRHRSWFCRLEHLNSHKICRCNRCKWLKQLNKWHIWAHNKI